VPKNQKQSVLHMLCVYMVKEILNQFSASNVCRLKVETKNHVGKNMKKKWENIKNDNDIFFDGGKLSEP
jgi:hypothetical protein